MGADVSTTRAAGGSGIERRDGAAGVPQGIAADPLQNRLLASLPEAEWQRWQPLLEPVAMPLGQVLYESGAC